ncbi:hypothetical protein TNCV_3007161 [Trichonephila clavipes]|nr:hypothetical protein TNCV_3007161 [Trichonephila clavipes]
MVRGGLMVVKGAEQQKIFLELGVFAMSLETLPEFNDIYDGLARGCARGRFVLHHGKILPICQIPAAV